MITLQEVIAIGLTFPIAKDPDFQQEARLIRLMTMSGRGARNAWREACRRYGYDESSIQCDSFSEIAVDTARTISRRGFFKAPMPSRKAFWAQVDAELLPEEKSTLWDWARQEEPVTPEVQDVLDTIIALTVPTR